MLKIQCGDAGVKEWLFKAGTGGLAGFIDLSSVDSGEGIQTYRKRLQSELMGLVGAIVVGGYEEEDDKGWYRMARLSGPMMTYSDVDYWDIRISLSTDGPQKWLRRYRRDKL